jgi:hypothetical protein
LVFSTVFGSCPADKLTGFTPNAMPNPANL